MEFRRLRPARDQDRLREFLSRIDPEDYLLEDLAEWARTGRSWVEEDRGEWVAFGRLHDLGHGEGWISGIRVLPALRGKGFGKRLLDALLFDARAIGVTGLRATIEDGNLVSRRLFERFGFQPVVALTLRRGLARRGATNLLHRAAPKEVPDGPVGWLPALSQRVDLLPGSDGGRFGAWRSSLLVRWAKEGKLYVGTGLSAAVQVDWWKEPRTLWVNPLCGDPASLFPALDSLTGTLDHEEWQAFLPSTAALRDEYTLRGLVPHPSWGDVIQLYERLAPAISSSESRRGTKAGYPSAPSPNA